MSHRNTFRRAEYCVNRLVKYGLLALLVTTYVALPRPAMAASVPDIVTAVAGSHFTNVEVDTGIEEQTGFDIDMTGAIGDYGSGYGVLSVVGPTDQTGINALLTYVDTVVEQTMVDTQTISGSEVRKYRTNGGVGVGVVLADYFVVVELYDTGFAESADFAASMVMAQELLDGMEQAGLLSREAPDLVDQESVTEDTGGIRALTDPERIIDTMNGGEAYNGPTVPLTFVAHMPHYVTEILTYHWNDGQGASPGTIALQHNDGTVYGPWQAVAGSGQGGAPNVGWHVYPNIVIPEGTYTVVDSDPATWSHNAQSGGQGMGYVMATPDFEVTQGEADTPPSTGEQNQEATEPTTSAPGQTAAGEAGSPAGVGAVGNIPGPATTAQAVIGVVVPGAVVSLLGVLGAIGGGSVPPVGPTTPLPPISGGGGMPPGPGMPGAGRTPSGLPISGMSGQQPYPGVGSGMRIPSIPPPTGRPPALSPFPVPTGNAPIPTGGASILTGKAPMPTQGAIPSVGSAASPMPSGYGAQEMAPHSPIGVQHSPPPQGAPLPGPRPVPRPGVDEAMPGVPVTPSAAALASPNAPVSSTPGMRGSMPAASVGQSGQVPGESITQSGVKGNAERMRLPADEVDNNSVLNPAHSRSELRTHGSAGYVDPEEGGTPDPQPEKHYDEWGYGKDGFNADGFDRDGYDRQGFDFEGYDRNGRDPWGYDRRGYDKDGYHWSGFNDEGYNRVGRHWRERPTSTNPFADDLPVSLDGTEAPWSPTQPRFGEPYPPTVSRFGPKAWTDDPGSGATQSPLPGSLRDGSPTSSDVAPGSSTRMRSVPTVTQARVKIGDIEGSDPAHDATPLADDTTSRVDTLGHDGTVDFEQTPGSDAMPEPEVSTQSNWEEGFDYTDPETGQTWRYEYEPGYDGPRHGQTETLVGHGDGQSYEIAFDATTGQWYNTDTGNEFDPSTFRQWQESVAEDRQRALSDLAKMAVRQDAASKDLDAAADSWHQLEQMEKLADKWNIGHDGGPGDISAAIQEQRDKLTGGGRVDLEKMRRIRQVIASRIEGKTEADTGPRWEEGWDKYLGWTIDAAAETTREVITGEHSDGTISWKGIVARVGIAALSGGFTEATRAVVVNGVMDVAEAMYRVSDSIAAGETGTQATAKAVGGYMMGEFLGEFIGWGMGKGMRYGAEAMDKYFPAASTRIVDGVEFLATKNKQWSRGLGLITEEGGDEILDRVNKTLVGMSDGAEGKLPDTTVRAPRLSADDYTPPVPKALGGDGAGGSGKLLSDAQRAQAAAHSTVRGSVEHFDDLPDATKADLLSEQARYQEYRLQAEENVWGIADKTLRGEDLTVDDLMRLKSDQASMRTLKKIEQMEGLGSQLTPQEARGVQTAFNQAMEEKVYRPSYGQVEDHIRTKYPDLEADQVRCRTVRTPGSDPKQWSINTDNDVVVEKLVPGPNGPEWVEIPKSEWEDVYYEAFADNSGYNLAEAKRRFPHADWDSMDQSMRLQQWAKFHEETPMDQFDLSAARDFSDQRTAMIPPSPTHGRPMIEVTQAELDSGVDYVIVDGKAMRPSTGYELTRRGQGTMIDPQQLGLMEQHKFDQYWNAGSTPAEVMRNQTEALEQLGKTAAIAHTVERSYQDMGYRIVPMPENMRTAIEVVTDNRLAPAVRAQRLQGLGFETPGALLDKIVGRIDAIKIARK